MAVSRFKFEIEVEVEDSLKEGEPYIRHVRVSLEAGNASGFDDMNVRVSALNHKEAARNVMTAACCAMQLFGHHQPPDLVEAAKALKKHCSWINP